jgi:hypothetical protein
LKLYWMAAFYAPKKKDKDDENSQERAVIVINPGVILAENESIATMKATRLIPAEYEDKLDQVTLAIRPF